jgi:hypothetical protein
MIEDIQKRRFLNNLYKLSYAYGSRINEEAVKSAYSLYFRNNPPGSPMSLDPESLRAQSITNVEAINYLMAKSIFNMDILYDAAYESVEELFELVTSLNARVDSLRSKRVNLEKKVDDIIFSITNSDGYFASITEEFSDLSGFDKTYSTAYLDTDSRSLSIPFITNSAFNAGGNSVSTSNEVTFTTYFNGLPVGTVGSSAGASSSNMFDGLTDTFWTKTHTSSAPGVASLKLDIRPLNRSSISKIYGRLVSEKPAKVILEINQPSTSESGARVFSAQSETDHDNFVFQFDPVSPSSISLFIIKTEPDRVIKNNSIVNYEYDFSIRDIVISGLYYDFSAIYVSNPITINSVDNNKYTIDRVALDVSAQNIDANYVDYFIAADNTGATSVDDFNWIPISPDNQGDKTNSNYIDFNGSNLDYRTIVSASDLNSSSKNVAYFKTEPETNIPGFENVPIYRVAKLGSDIDYIEPTVLEGVNRYKWYRVSYAQDRCADIASWKNTILPQSDSNVTVIESSDNISSGSSFWSAPNISEGGSVLISFDILCDSDIKVEKTFAKDDLDSSKWDVCVYLNGTLLRRIRPDVSIDSIIWEFKKGKNNVTVAIDAAPRSTAQSVGGLYGSFTLMQQSRISNYGFIYQNYLSYISPFLLRSNNAVVNDVFTITTIDTEKYLISNKKILLNSRMYFYSNNDSPVNSVRVKIDLRRSRTAPKSSPIVTSYRLKFKRSETIASNVTRTSSEILRGSDN